MTYDYDKLATLPVISSNRQSESHDIVILWNCTRPKLYKLGPAVFQYLETRFGSHT